MMSKSLNASATSEVTALESLTHDPSPTAKVPVGQTFRHRDHHYSALPVKLVLKTRMRDLELTNSDLQRVMAYDRPNVIAMMRSGSMRVPVTKVSVLAKVLQVDPVFFLGKVLAENDATTWKAIAAIMGDRLVTANEMKLITQLRELLNGHDVNLVEHEAFARIIKPKLIEIVERQDALASAS